MKKREEEFKQEILNREEIIERNNADINEMKAVIKEINAQLNDESRQTNKMID